MSRRRLTWGQRFGAAASLIFGGAASWGRFGPLVSSQHWSRNLADDESVDGTSALTISAVWSCVNILADVVSQLPVHVYRKDGERRVLVGDHAVTRLFGASGLNDFQSRAGFMRTLEFSRGLQGEGFAQVERDGDTPVGLWPIANASPKRDASGRLTYTVTAGGVTQSIEPRDIIHIRGASLNGLNGLSPISAARRALWLAVHTENYGVKFFKHDAISGGFIVQQAQTNSLHRKQKSDEHTDEQGGPDRAWKIKVLDPGAKYVPTGVTQEDSQYLDTRKFQLHDTCRFFGVPIVLVDSTAATAWGSGIEQLILSFTTFKVATLAMSWEEELTQKLLSPEERASGLYVRVDLRGLLRGDMAARAAYYQSASLNGWLTINEIRALEERDPLPGGDTLRTPLNMAPGGDEDEPEEVRP